MSSSHRHQATLAYYQPSPVRGQLEPYDPESRTGWRYLQCTDTPNELKVLLPPKTSVFYSQLLQQENAELAKGRSADWDRIVHIRHLKDRMIRKCQRLGRMAQTPSGAAAAFRVVHAPVDFRLKEMERWLRDQEPRVKSTKEVRRPPSADTTGTRTQSAQSGYAPSSTRSPRTSRVSTSAAPPQRVSSTRAPGPVKRRASGSTRSSGYVDSRTSNESLRQRPPAQLQTPAHIPPHHTYLSPVTEEHSVSTPQHAALPNPFGDTPQHATEADAFASAAAARADVISPDPLPHLYRPPSMHMPMAEMAAMLGGMPEPVVEPLPDPAPPSPPPDMMPEPVVESFPPADPAMHGMPEPMLDPDQPILGGRPPLVRRRSSLKQGGRFNANGTPKVVSWAMDRDWADHMTKFDHMVYAAEFASSELEEERRRFQEEISGVQSLRQTLASALERLRLESDTLHREEMALREHEERMVASFESLKAKEAHYKEKVQAIVDESKRAVIAADTRRDSTALS
ncbi:hypothetical protein BC834DRAFT_927771 [Gloeopeniophorella convolvens]|nr:hypothetical protein BC834DRAFT_927771 [Gloeopeniophorella convolvens]